MIRILFIHSKDERKAYKVHEYRDEDFGYLVEGEPGRGVEGPPFRDEDSARVINEAAHAEFVDHDWFSIVSKEGRRSCVTALREDIRYALTLVANSRKKIYTSYEWRGDDMWEVLADLSVDILLYLEVSGFDVTYPVIDLPEAVYHKVEIVNHDFKGVRTSGILAAGCEEGDKLLDSGELQISNYFLQYCFDWRKNIDRLISKAEELLYKSGDWYRHAPVISTVEEFAATLEPDFASAFYDHYKPETGRRRKYKVSRQFNHLQIHNYLYQVPTETVEKYPMYLVMTKDTESGKCTVRMECGVRYPSFSDAMTESFVMPKDSRGTCVTLTVVIDTMVFSRCEDSFRKAVWAFRYYDNTVELYDNHGVFEQFVGFIKQPFEDGLVTVADGED